MAFDHLWEGIVRAIPTCGGEDYIGTYKDEELGKPPGNTEFGAFGEDQAY